MALDLVPLDPLERGQLHVMRVHALVTAVSALILAIVGDFFAVRQLDWWPGLVTAPFLLYALWSAGFAPGRRWRRWGYAFTGSELHVAHGWLVRVHTIVPVARVQHIDVSQGPIERAFGVARLVVHTAGTDNSLVALPGITRARAEEIRDAIRAQLNSAPW